MGKTADALASYEQARLIWEALIDGNPANTRFRNNLANSLGIAGLFRLRIDQKEQGRSNLRSALAIMERSLAQSSTELYNQACFRAVLSGTAPQPGIAATDAQARDDADQAMRALRRLIAVGFRNTALLRTDHDLDTLRSRPDFQSLLGDVEFPAEPFAP
jgi:hypothetical protein